MERVRTVGTYHKQAVKQFLRDRIYQDSSTLYETSQVLLWSTPDRHPDAIWQLPLSPLQQQVNHRASVTDLERTLK